MELTAHHASTRTGSPKLGWGSVLGRGRRLTSLPAGGQPGRPRSATDPRINQALVEGATTGRFSDQPELLPRPRAEDRLTLRIRVPTLIVEGTVDTLFTLRESMENHGCSRTGARR